MNALDKAKAIVAASDSVTYPSGAAARHVRAVMRELIEIIEARAVEQSTIEEMLARPYRLNEDMAPWLRHRSRS